MREIDLVYRTMYAELEQRCLDAQFARDFPIQEVEGAFSIDGSFYKATVKGEQFWYHRGPSSAGRPQTYVGPVSDEAISRRVEEFSHLKDDLSARRKLVSTLVREVGFARADPVTGDVVEALAAAGLFRLRCVLVGTVAFQCYPALLGIRFPASALQTGDADFAQFHSISNEIGESIPPILEILRGVDKTFREIPHESDSRRSTRFSNGSRYQVEFLTPNTGSADHDGRPASMPALGGAAATPLRFLDFLIHQPVRSVMLHRGGVPVLTPAPERYAVHKLIVASRRNEHSPKRSKDVLQAGLIAQALITTRSQADLALAYAEAWNRGPAWREGLERGLSLMDAGARAVFREGLCVGLGQVGEDPSDFGFDPPARGVKA